MIVVIHSDVITMAKLFYIVRIPSASLCVCVFISQSITLEMISMSMRQITCEECGAPMGDGVIQPDGSIRFVCTKDFGHILFVRQNN
jgi:hypothetical protein